MKQTPLGFLPDEEAPAPDMRKLQKKLKKKSDKDNRRVGKSGSNEDYDFDADYKY